MQHAFLVELADTPGALADVTEAIAAKGVNITSVSGTTCGERAGSPSRPTTTLRPVRPLPTSVPRSSRRRSPPSRCPTSRVRSAKRRVNWRSAGVNIESVLLLGMQGNDIEVGFVTSDPVMARTALAHAGSATG